MAALEQFQGCLLGLALGDALGARYEGGILERCLWWWIGTTRQGEMRWTDDTQMSLDVVESYLATGQIDSDDLARRFSQSYRWSRGYGPGSAKVLKRIAAGRPWREANRSVYPSGSYGNGAAMRAPLVGLIYAIRAGELAAAAEASAVVTHAHPLAIAGAVLMATATASVARGVPTREIMAEAIRSVFPNEFTNRLAIAERWLDTGEVTKREVVRELGNGIAAHESVVTALYLALRFRQQPFMSLQKFVITCGGDTDTIGAMAGAVWGAANGLAKLPGHLLAKLEQRERLLNLGEALQKRISL